MARHKIVNGVRIDFTPEEEAAREAEEAAWAAGQGYDGSADKAQAATFHDLTDTIGNGADESCAGIMHLFSPSSTTYVKHFYATLNCVAYFDYQIVQRTAGYINDTTAIDEIQFKMSSGNFDGVIQMYGIA